MLQLLNNLLLKNLFPECFVKPNPKLSKVDQKVATCSFSLSDWIMTYLLNGGVKHLGQRNVSVHEKNKGLQSVAQPKVSIKEGASVQGAGRTLPSSGGHSVNVRILEEFNNRVIENNTRISSTQKEMARNALNAAIEANDQTSIFRERLGNFESHPGQADYLTNEFRKAIDGEDASNRGKVKRSIILHAGQHGDYVAFYKEGPTAFLGNFFVCREGVVMNNVRYATSEAAFQCERFLQTLKNPDHNARGYNRTIHHSGNEGLSTQLKRAFAACKYGEAAFQLRNYLEGSGGRGSMSFGISQGIFRDVYPKGWTSGGRDEAMRAALKSKFIRNPDLLRELKGTANAYLLEHNLANRDNYWSDNSNGTGYNILGQMLMGIRAGALQNPILWPMPKPFVANKKGEVPVDSPEQFKIKALARHFNSHPNAYGKSIY